jgi:hypothetical protein
MTARTRYVPIPRPLPVLPIPVYVPPSTRIVNCDTCHCDMPHALNKSQTAYVCGCGTELEYHVNNAPATLAIR